MDKREIINAIRERIVLKRVADAKLMKAYFWDTHERILQEWNKDGNRLLNGFKRGNHKFRNRRRRNA